MRANTYSEALEIAYHNFKKSGLVCELIEAREPNGKYYYILAPKGHIVNGNFTPLQ